MNLCGNGAGICLGGVMVFAAGCGDSLEGPETEEASFEERFNANMLNNLTQHPEDTSMDVVYPEFVLNMEEVPLASRTRIDSVWVVWPDGRTTGLDQDFRPGDGILRYVGHDLDRVGTRAPEGVYRFHIRFEDGDTLLRERPFDQHVMPRPSDVSILRTGDDLGVSWVAPALEHLWTVEIQVGDYASGETVVFGSGPNPTTGGRIDYAFPNPPLTDGVTYHLAIVMSDPSNLRGHEVPFIW